MDKYLKIFSAELDAAFKPETLFPGKKNYIPGWLKRKFIFKRNIKNHMKEISTANDNAPIEYA